MNDEVCLTKSISLKPCRESYLSPWDERFAGIVLLIQER